MEYTAAYIIERRKEKWEADHDIARDRIFREILAAELVKNKRLLSEFTNAPENIIEAFFVIVDKNQNTTPFFLNEVQQDFVQRLNKAIDDFNNGRITEVSMLVLKGRQQGFTSVITAIQLASIIVKKNFSGYTIADVSDNAETIFTAKAKYPYSQLPEAIKPTEKYNTKRMLYFEKLNSSWEAVTATKQGGRSRTLNFLHASECAYWSDGISSTQAALGEALTKNCIKIYESTANGLNDYHSMWESGVHINCFYEWWRTPEYCTNFESEEAREAFYTFIGSGEEWIQRRLRWLLERGITPQQAYWYYQKWLRYIDKELIKQEYPCTPDEAFISSGRPVFNTENVLLRIAELTDRKIRTGHFSYQWENPDTKDKIKDDTITFEDGTGDIRIYEEVQKDYPYVLAGDTKGEGKDYYTATVINNITGNRAATLRMQINESSPYTYQVYCLGKYYNDALIGIEINFNTAPCEELSRLGYPRQYMRQRYDDATRSIQKKVGWKTDGNTRPLIIDREAKMIQEHIELFNDVDMLRECITFVYDKNNRPDAMPGHHDDLLFSDMIAQEIRGQQSASLPEHIRKPFYNFEFENPKQDPSGYGDSIKVI